MGYTAECRRQAIGTSTRPGKGVGVFLASAVWPAYPMKAGYFLAAALGVAGLAMLGLALRIHRAGAPAGGFLVVAGLFLLLLAILAARPERERSAKPGTEEFVFPAFFETALLFMAVFLALAITAYVFSRAHGIGRM